MNSSSMDWINPNPGDFSEEADVTRLRMFRNKFVHEGSSKLSEKEFSAMYVELRDVISRLARSSGCIDFSAMVDRLEQKKVGYFEYFEKKPAVNDQATSVSSSLEETIVDKPEFHVNNVSANEDGLEGKCRYHKVEVIDPAGSLVSFQGSDSTIYETPTIGDTLLTPHTKDVGTSTCNLQPKRKLSKKLSDAIRPFIRPPLKNTENDLSKSSVPLPIRIKRKTKVRQNLPNWLCLTSKSRFREHSSVVLPCHSDRSPLRCQITGMVCNENGQLIITDCVHNSMQVFDAAGMFLDENECPQPSGVCLVFPDLVAVNLRIGSCVQLLRYDLLQQRFHCVERIQLKCDLKHYDMKCDNSYIYILCENGSLHRIHKIRKPECGLIRPSGITEKVNSFDLCKHFFYLSTNDAIYCIDDVGSRIWTYSPSRSSGETRKRRSFEGLTVTNNCLYVAKWARNSILKMSLRGDFLAEVELPTVACPFKLTSAGRRLLISQYSTDLKREACGTIVQLKHRRFSTNR
ncbi:uncharacterized protein LOC127866799 [Dreissena polymorpha]|uniref:uncharacterized protein LOC127866799 n=1 Tax=Dreissena polymorpha TaxID=45954 RepID=UPI0022652E15|nr:uncharacterized protein LOC127866799 [Dreissena polymorpha]